MEDEKLTDLQLRALRLYCSSARFAQDNGLPSPTTPNGLEPKRLARWCVKNKLPLPSDYLRTAVVPKDRKSPPD